MTFNSASFIFVYLPAAILGFALIVRRSPPLVVLGLVIASFVFYGWVKPALIVLLFASTSLNYLIGRMILEANRRNLPQAARVALWLGIAIDLAALGYFKYANFFIGLDSHDNALEFLLGTGLPIGISFFTFTQIAFLVDVSQGEVKTIPITEYFLFVSYFPHLVAGPIIRYKEMIPQFQQAARQPVDLENLAAGLSIFALGLIKKLKSLTIWRYSPTPLSAKFSRYP